MLENLFHTKKNDVKPEKINTSGKRGRKITGVVVSDKMKKTIVVAINHLKLHPKYKKYYKITNRFKVHDEKNEYHIGDKVVIQETRPLSKEKRWIVVDKV